MGSTYDCLKVQHTVQGSTETLMVSYEHATMPKFAKAWNSAVSVSLQGPQVTWLAQNIKQVYEILRANHNAQPRLIGPDTDGGTDSSERCMIRMKSAECVALKGWQHGEILLGMAGVEYLVDATRDIRAKLNTQPAPAPEAQAS